MKEGASVQSRARGRSPETTSRIMSSVRSKDTEPELVLRRAVHALGGRFRVHARDVYGCPDIVVRSRKVAIFVDGDFWHGNPAELERRGLSQLSDLFRVRTDWWVKKIQGNVRRDSQVNVYLREQGWNIVRLWASEVLADPTRSARIVLEALDSPHLRIGSSQTTSRTNGTADSTDSNKRKRSTIWI